MYGGTMHSSTMDLRKNFTPEQIKRGTMRTTNKAFERYFQLSKDELENLYSHSMQSIESGPRLGHQKTSNKTK